MLPAKSTTKFTRIVIPSASRTRSSLLCHSITISEVELVATFSIPEGRCGGHMYMDAAVQNGGSASESDISADISEIQA